MIETFIVIDQWHVYLISVCTYLLHRNTKETNSLFFYKKNKTIFHSTLMQLIDMVVNRDPTCVQY